MEGKEMSSSFCLCSLDRT